MWAMERRHTDGIEPTLDDSVRRIAEAGFDGISAHWFDRPRVRQHWDLMTAHGLGAEGQCFPKTVDDLARVLEVASEFPPHHLNVQPDVRPRRLQDCIPLIEGWMLGHLFYPLAMEAVAEYPPANDTAPAERKKCLRSMFIC